MAHPARPMDYPAANISKKQLEQLKAEPMLIVQELDEPEPKVDKK